MNGHRFAIPGTLSNDNDSLVAGRIVTQCQKTSTKSMLNSFEQQLISYWPAREWSEVTVLVAVSGGSDSMALLRSLGVTRGDTRGRLVAAHFNHRLRGSESDQDEAFVLENCLKLGVTCVSAAASTSSGTPSEDAARQSRYDFLCQAAKEQGARYVATAHTADDQVETILHRILRGTGIDGLAGIPKSREFVPGVSLIRPLLWATREQVLQYLNAIEQPYRHDSSNEATRFTRNRLRRELIPLLEREYNPRVRAALLRLGELAAETQCVLENLVDELYLSAVSTTRLDGATIRCDRVVDANPHLIRQLFIRIWQSQSWPLQEMTAEHWRRLEELCTTNPQGKLRMNFPSGVTAQRQDSMLQLRGPLNSPNDEIIA